MRCCFLRAAPSCRRTAVGLFTVCFALFCAVAFMPFVVAGKTFVYYYDGIRQHLVAYIYYGRLVRHVLRSIFVAHELSLPQFDIAIGYGSDIMQTLNYYCIGDPFAFLSFLVPERWTYAFYTAMNVARLYLAGLSFIFLCFEFGRTRTAAVVSGALMYVFCHYALLNAAGHPYFLNPLIFFPLVVCGVERVIRGRSPRLFVAATAVSAASNLYFFYMIALLAGVFAAVRLAAVCGGDVRWAFGRVFSLALHALLAALISAVVLFPSLHAFLVDPRLGGAGFSLLYPPSYYFNIALNLFSIRDDFWLVFSFPLMAAVCWLALWARPAARTTLRALFAVCAALMLFPFFGQALNGFSYATNRWSWAFALLASFLLVSEWDALSARKAAREMVADIALALLLALFVAAKVVRSRGFLREPQCLCLVFQLALFALFLLARSARAYSAHGQKVAFGFVCASLWVSSLFLYTRFGDGLVSRCLSAEETRAVFAGAAGGFKEFVRGKDGFFRFTPGGEEGAEENVPMVAGVPSTSYYWTISNGAVSDLYGFLEIPAKQLFRYRNFGGRAIPTALTATNYFCLTGGGSQVPFGFVPTERDGIFENMNALPFGYAYGSYSLLADAEGMSAPEREELMLSSVLVESPPALAEKHPPPQFRSVSVPYTVSRSDGVSFRDGAFSVEKEDGEIELSFEAIPESELYVRLTGLSLSADVATSVVSLAASDGSARSFTFCTERFEWYHRQKDFCVSMGWSGGARTSLRIAFEEPGEYTFSGLEIICLPLGDLGEKVGRLGRTALSDVRFGTNRIGGKIGCGTSCVLCVPVPYLKGWSAFVDGKRTATFRGNVMFLALELEAGEHDVELRYRTPFLALGALVSLAALALSPFVLSGRRGALRGGRRSRRPPSRGRGLPPARG